jgi:hypothetical protein
MLKLYLGLTEAMNSKLTNINHEFLLHITLSCPKSLYLFKLQMVYKFKPSFTLYLDCSRPYCFNLFLL